MGLKVLRSLEAPALYATESNYGFFERNIEDEIITRYSRSLLMPPKQGGFFIGIDKMRTVVWFSCGAASAKVN